MQFFIVEAEDGMWGWQLKSGDDIVAVSPATYADIASVRRAVEEVKRVVATARLPDQE
ncbi:MAG: DUF1508 domain-containing protein [Variovorax sp.]|jgi:uncharacterized protein YegP (UPF0339 family)|nr:MAG: DUF1508 domain-containing protein [Variovorax sp.]